MHMNTMTMTIEQRREAAYELISEGEALLEEIEQELLEDRKATGGIAIHEGGYYLTRKGHVRGPMRPLPESGYSGYKWTDAAEGEVIYGNVWTDEGFYLVGDAEPDALDLVSEHSPLP